MPGKTIYAFSLDHCKVSRENLSFIEKCVDRIINKLPPFFLDKPILQMQLTRELNPRHTTHGYKSHVDFNLPRTRVSVDCHASSEKQVIKKSFCKIVYSLNKKGIKVGRFEKICENM